VAAAAVVMASPVAPTSSPSPSSPYSAGAGGAAALASASAPASASASLRDRLAAAQMAVEGLKAQLEQRRHFLSSGGLAAAVAARGEPLRALGAVPHKVADLEGHFNKVYALDWVDDERLVSASQEGKLMLWNARTQRKLRCVSLKSAWVMTCAAERGEGQLVGSGGLDNVCTLLDLGPPSQAASAAATAPVVAELVGHEGYVSTCRFVGGREQVLTGSGDATCMLWDVARAARVAHFKDHGGDVMSLSVSPTSPHVFVSGACDATAKVWDVRAGRCVTTFEEHEGDVNAVRFMPGGLAFGSGSDDSSAKVFDLRACASVNEMQHENVTCAVTSLDLSESGRLLFAGYDSAACYAWDALGEAAPAPVFSLAGHESRVSCLGVSSQGHAVATGSWDHRVAIWI
jgi:guanine nucleotide-binding protein G(I)/G(S)/G(T) subunit beta-1